MTHPDRKRIIVSALALIGLAAFLCGLLSFALLERSTKTSSAPSTSPTPASTVKIKVGVVLSHFSASALLTPAKPAGYDVMKWLIREDLRSPEFDLHPVIDPGTAGDSALASVLRAYFAGKSPIDCSNHEALAEMDVIVSLGQAQLTPEMIAGLTDFVANRGRGLVVRSFFGIMSPGLSPEISALTGLTRAGYLFGQDQDAECEIVATHPILGDLPVGTKLLMQVNGQYGPIVDGAPLITLTDPVWTARLKEASSSPEGNVAFNPLYISKLGKGRIVGAPWSWVNKKIAQPLTSAQLMHNSIRWLASEQSSGK